MNVNGQQISICIVTESFYPNLDGGAVYARLLAEQFSAKCGGVYVVTRRDFPEYPPSETLAGIPVIRVGPDNRLGILGRYTAMISVCIPLIKNRRNYDLVLVSNLRILGAPVIVLAKLLGKKCIVRTDSCGELSGHYAVSGMPKYSLKRLLITTYLRTRNFIISGADAFVAISNDIVGEFRAAKIPAKRINLIPNGVDTELFRPAKEAERNHLRLQFGLPVDALIFAYSGRLTREKGLSSLIRVWKMLTADFSNIHLLLIGSGCNMSLSCENELHSFVKQHHLEDSVTFTGRVDNVPEYLQCADVFIFPSQTEALGLALIEAQSCGLPAIGSNVGGIPDVIEHDISGKLVESGDDKQLYDAAMSLLSDSGMRSQMGNAGRQIVLDNFSLEHITESYLKLFNQVVSGNTGSRQLGRNGKMDDRTNV